MKIKLFLSLASFLFFANLSFAEFAVMTHLGHDCGQGGSVTYELIEGSGPYTYFWEDGATSLERTNLAAGNYTLTVENFYGCIEVYEVEILALTGCQMYSYVTYTLDPCVAAISIWVYDDNGSPISEQALDIQWADGSIDGLTRLVNLSTPNSYCVTISLVAGNGSCCLLSECINVSANPNCSEECSDEMLVNELNRFTEGTGKYVELMVLGKCECNKTTDIRGYILDDNNGFLIPGNESVNAFSMEQTIGASPGYLVFTQDDNWANVPNGSLIVVYDQDDGTVPNFPSDDPTDANGDGVYVVQASNTDYFYAKTGTWNELEKSMEYTGGLSTPSWDRVNVNATDGIQLRDNTGAFIHGISFGETNFSEPNDFPLWLTNATTNDRNCQFLGSDFWDKNDFTCFEASQSLQTPGLPNSNDNNDLRNWLRDCGTVPGLKENGAALKNENDKYSSEKETVIAFPNPFTNLVNIQYNSEVEGQASLRLFSSSGQLVIDQNTPSLIGDNLYELNVDGSLPSGLLILEFVFPSGKKESLKLTHFQID